MRIGGGYNPGMGARPMGGSTGQAKAATSVGMNGIGNNGRAGQTQGAPSAQAGPKVSPMQALGMLTKQLLQPSPQKQQQPATTQASDSSLMLYARRDPIKYAPAGEPKKDSNPFLQASIGKSEGGMAKAAGAGKIAGAGRAK